jgi:hypothetical protein
VDILGAAYGLLGRVSPSGSPKGLFDVSPMSAAAGVSIPDNAALWTPLCSFQVPDSHLAWVRAYGVAVPDAVKATLRLHIRLGGSFCKNFPNGITQLVAGLRGDELEEVWIPVQAGQLVELVIGQGGGAGAQTCHGRLKILVAEV